jgi:hypothetical protein
MKTPAIVCNVVLFAFTCMVMATDGLPTKAAYIVFTVWSLVTLILSPIVISKSDAGKIQDLPQGKTPLIMRMKVPVIVMNMVFIGFHCWAFVDQYPHPNEEGFAAYVALMLLTPILNLVVLFRSVKKTG